MGKMKLPKHYSPMQSRCEEIADKIIASSNDRNSIIQALRVLSEERFEEGYRRCSLDINYQKAAHRRAVQKDWLSQREQIVFNSKRKKA